MRYPIRVYQSDLPSSIAAVLSEVHILKGGHIGGNKKNTLLTGLIHISRWSPHAINPFGHRLSGHLMATTPLGLKNPPYARLLSRPQSVVGSGEPSSDFLSPTLSLSRLHVWHPQEF